MSVIEVITKAGKIQIRSELEINSGGEGTVYEIDSDTVAKIYHPGVNPISIKKFQFLSGLDPNYFVAPIELLYDNKGVVIGYTMKYIDQSFFPLSNLYNKTFCQTHKIDKNIKLKVIEKLIAAIKYAHKENVVIGDLNPFNILVNDKGVVKLIDTDSYQTPGFPHSHILMDEIRDYLYQGRVSKDSDFFALSILSFNMLAFLHPFKGIHNTYKKIGDRMIHKLPVFVNNPDIKIPKCYEPIQDKNFLDQFKKFYLQGERFLLSLTGVDNSLIATSPLKKPSLVKKYEQDDLLITMITQSDTVINVNFTDDLGVIETNTSFLVYDVRNKGYVTQKHRISKSDYDKVFIGNQNILLKKGKEIYHYKDSNHINLMSNVSFPDKHIIRQMGNILIVIGTEDMYKIFLDEVGPGIIRTERVSVFGRGFNNHNGLIHNSGGKQNILYNSGKNISVCPSPIEQLIGLYQTKNVGILQYMEKNTPKRKFFKIQGLKAKISQKDIDAMSNFAYFPNTDSRGNEENEGMIFVPVDDRIDIYRTNDFEKVSEMKCGIVSSETSLFKTKSGIIAWEGNDVVLLNKK